MGSEKDEKKGAPSRLCICDCITFTTNGYNFCKLYIHKATRSYCFLYLKSQRLVSLLSSITQQPQVWNHCGQTTLRDLSRWRCQKMTRSDIRHSQQMKSGNERSQTISCLWLSQTTLNARYFKEMENYGICTILFVAFFGGGTRCILVSVSLNYFQWHIRKLGLICGRLTV